MPRHLRSSSAAIGAAALLVAGTGTAVAGHDRFSDAATSVHEPGIHWVSERGITRGCTADRYCPAELVTRGQMASFLHRLSGHADVPPSVDADTVDGLHAADLRGQQGPAGERGPAGPPGPAGAPATGQFSTEFAAYGVSFGLRCPGTTEYRLIASCYGASARNGLPRLFDASRFPAGTHFFLDVTLAVNNGARGCVRLVDSGAVEPVEGSEVCRLEGGALVRSGPLALPAGPTTLVLEGRVEPSDDPAATGPPCEGEDPSDGCHAFLEMASLVAVVG